MSNWYHRETRIKRFKTQGRSIVLTKKLLIKIRESLTSVLPITAIVVLLHIFVAPMSFETMALFLVGAVFLILGMGLFTLGADTAMMPMGEQMGAQLTKSRNLSLLVIVCFLMGIVITVAEPDLQILAQQVPAVPDAVLIAAVAIGVGIFLVIALLRIVFQLKLSYILIFFYIVVFGLAAFAPDSFLAVAFDSGGVTTGPITVPFIMALGVGVASVRGGRSSEDDSFGLISLCSVGPILAVLIMGMLYNSSSGGYAASLDLPSVKGLGQVLMLFVHSLPEYMKEVADSASANSGVLLRSFRWCS